mgnify:CR=1 FL=1
MPVVSIPGAQQFSQFDADIAMLPGPLGLTLQLSQAWRYLSNDVAHTSEIIFGFRQLIDGTSPLDQWVLLGVGTAPAPAGTVSAQAVLVKVDVDGSQGGSIFWDDASLMRPVPVEPTTFGKIKQLFD